MFFRITSRQKILPSVSVGETSSCRDFQFLSHSRENRESKRLAQLATVGVWIPVMRRSPFGAKVREAPDQRAMLIE